jgi:deoxycytidine triphosphate deaminase
MNNVDLLKQEALAGDLAVKLTDTSSPVRKNAKKRLDYLDGTQDLEVKIFQEEEWDLNSLKVSLRNLEKKNNSAIVDPRQILEDKIVYTAPGVLEIDRSTQLQQVGIDLRLANAYRVVGNATFSNDESQTQKPSLIEMQITGGFFLFKKGELYSLDFMEDVSVRSSINRFVGTIEAGVYDSGFKSKGGCGAVFRTNTDVKVEVGYRMAQIVFFTATNATTYNGQYQGT